MNNPPAYQYYAADFDEDTASWNNEEVGIYQRLLNYSWINGWNHNEGLPDDPKRLAMIVRCSYKKFQKSWEIISKKFSKQDRGFLINRRLEEERGKLLKYIESQRESGKRGAEKRWKKDSDPNGDPISKPNGETMALLSSSSSLEEERVKKEEEIIELCDQIAKLIGKSIFNPYSFNNKNKRKRPEARFKVLTRCKEEIDKKNEDFIKDPWPYLNHILSVEHQNVNEREAIQEHEKRKKEFKAFSGELMGKLKKGGDKQ